MKKKKDFMIDKVSEESFFQNLLLGVPALLKSIPFVSGVKLERLKQCNLENIRYWEYINSIALPEDLRAFYLSTNGFHLSFKISLFKDDRSYSSSGGIKINSLDNLKEIAKYSDAPNTRMFDLVHLDGNTDVIVAYSSTYFTPTYWLYQRPISFKYLSADFTTYFRMALAHLGIPGWQLGNNMSSETAEIYRMLAPGILARNCEVSEELAEINIIDPSLFDSIDSRSSTVVVTKSKAVEGIEAKKKSPTKKTNKL